MPPSDRMRRGGVFIVQVQKPGGALAKASQAALAACGYAPITSPYKDKQYWNLQNDVNGNDSITIVYSRLGDAISNVKDGFTDVAIVSTDALERWQACAKETCRNKIKVVSDLGLSGCCAMLMLPQEFAGQDWRKLLNGSKVVTSDSQAFWRFKKSNDVSYMTLTEVIERQGGTETLARALQDIRKFPVMIFDLVATGKSAFDNGFFPVARGDESKMLLIANRWNDDPELEAFCNTVQKNVESIRDASREIFLETLNNAYKKETRPKPRAFLASRILELRGGQR